MSAESFPRGHDRARTCAASRLVTLLRSVTSFVILVSVSTQGADVGAQGVDALLESIREKHHAPALAAAASIGGRIVALGATGVRKLGSLETVRADDLWHIGSCTKSMTAALAAVLVEEQKIRWDSTVNDTFPELRASMHESWGGVTLEQLLAHRGGAPTDPPADLWAAAWQQRGTPLDQRKAFVAGLLGRATASKPGTMFAYSNQGYAIAGTMLEKASGGPLEELMAQKLFGPLGLKSAGFGAPGAVGKIDQPRGHRTARGKLEPLEPTVEADNPPAISAAGRVHLSMSDFARYAAWHARAGGKGTEVLDAHGFKKLHTAAAGGDYALGLGVHQRGWAGGPALSHSGSNTYWSAVMWIAPAKNAAFVAATNFAGDAAAAACDDAVAALIGKYLPPP